MSRGRMSISAALLLLAALALATYSSDQGESQGDAVAGKRLFTESGCAGCHTFSAASAEGTQGPDLDAASPTSSKVMRQLEHPGGLMPSYATRLSEREKRDLAAFVGGPESSGMPVAAVFQPDSKRLSDCRDGNFQCLEQAFGNLTFNEGPKVALDRLQKTSTTNEAVQSDCHQIAHRMGSAALAHFDDEVPAAFAAGTTFCFSGYYHGIIERAFLGQPTDKLVPLAQKLCSDSAISDDRFLKYQCVHGIGHGVMIYTGYDLPTSLTTCDGLKTDFDQVSCQGGVFMENFNSSYGVSSKYLREDDPIYPCNAVSERHKQQCYGLITANILRLTDHDQRKAADACREAERGWVSMCFQSFGRAVSGIAGKSASKALASCKLARSHEGDCLYAVSRDIVSFDAGAERAGRFCQQVPSKHRRRCHVGLGSVLVSLEPTPAALKAACRRISGRYARSCAKGAAMTTPQR
ncbi:MAG: c-type cytochrome [Solirubrobacteraceae bacterium]